MQLKKMPRNGVEERRKEDHRATLEDDPNVSAWRKGVLDNKEEVIS